MVIITLFMATCFIMAAGIKAAMHLIKFIADGKSECDDNKNMDVGNGR